MITTDAEGNETTTNFIIKVVDTTAPPAPAINPIKEGAKEISGKAEPGSTVVITFPDGQTAEGKQTPMATIISKCQPMNT